MEQKLENKKHTEFIIERLVLRDTGQHEVHYFLDNFLVKNSAAEESEVRSNRGSHRRTQDLIKDLVESRDKRDVPAVHPYCFIKHPHLLRNYKRIEDVCLVTQMYKIFPQPWSRIEILLEAGGHGCVWDI